MSGFRSSLGLRDVQVSRFVRLLGSTVRRVVLSLTNGLVDFFRSSLRRRIILGLAVMFVAGYIALSTAWYWLSEDWVSGSFESCFKTSPFGAAQCDVASWNTTERVLVPTLVLFGLGVCVWIFWLVARRLLVPLRTAAESVRRVGPQNLGQRVALSGANDELKALADALDDALDRVAAGYESQRRFSSNASHELRTPLAVQRLLTEVAMDDPAASDDLRRLGGLLLRTNERNERLIEGLLVLADSDRGLQGKVPVRLDQLADSVLAAHQELADKRKVVLRHDLAERVVFGDPLLLERLLTNLVANAIAYNDPGGWVQVVVAQDPAITVSNTGQSVPAELVSSLFEPFRRLAADRTNHSGGSGLGLSIVRSIAMAHDGMVQAWPREGEGGLTVTIELPPAGVLTWQQVPAHEPRA